MKISKRGFSVIGSLLGFSLLGLSTIGLATYMGSFEEVKVSYAQSANVQFMHSELIANMEKIMAMTHIKVTSPTKSTAYDTNNKKNKKQYGLCKVINDSSNNNNYNAFADKTICPLFLKESSIVKADNYKDTAERFTYFIQEGNNWELKPGKCDKGAREGNNDINGFLDNFPDDEFNKCFKYKDESGGSHIYARLSLQPQKMPAFNAVENNTASSIPVDELAYKLQSVISVRKELEPGQFSFSMSKGEKYLWSAEVLDCHICSGGQCKLARFSSSAQGTAARHSRVCYHSTYAIEEKKDALKIQVEKAPIVVQSGGNLDLGSSSYSAVCRHNLFRCDGSVEKQNFDPTVNFRFLLNYDQPEDSYIHEVDLQVTDGSTTHKNYGTLFTPADQKSQVTRKKDGTLIQFSASQWPLRAGTNEVKAFMAHQNSSSSICMDVCGSTSPSFYPKLTVKYGDSLCDNGSHCSKTETASSRNIACYQCNMKSCHRYGRKTYAVRTSGASQPADGLVPECFNINGSDRNIVEGGVADYHDDYELNLTNPSASFDTTSGSNLCLQLTSRGQAAAVNCQKTSGAEQSILQPGASARSVCFAEGKSQVIAGGYSGGLDAGGNCRSALFTTQKAGEQGGDGVWTEGVLTSLSAAYNIPPDTVQRNLETGLTYSGKIQTFSISGNKMYRFYNFAQLASFFGNHRNSSFSSSDYPAFLPFQRDLSGMFHSGWHRYTHVWTGSNQQKERWAYFYREPLRSIDFEDSSKVGVGSGPSLPSSITRQEFLGRVRPSRPIYIKLDHEVHPDYDGHDATVDESGPGDFLALVHHWAYKGIRPVSGGSGKPFLCRNISSSSDPDFVTTTATTGNGYQRCQELGANWYFIPPTSTSLWAAALQAVAPNSPRYPFPNPFNFPDGIPFWREWKAIDTDYDSKMKKWVLSYKYEDMSSDDYEKSFSSDNEFFFYKERGVLAYPSSATALVGGLKKAVASGSIAGVGKSWHWKPDWINIFKDSSGNSTLGTGSGDPELQHGRTIAQAPSLLFEGKEASDITPYLTKLDDSTELKNIGAVNYSGRLMTTRSLREASDLNHIKAKVSKLCRYNDQTPELKFHKALMVLGTNSNWVSNDECSNYTTSNSSSFLSNSYGDKIYGKISSSPGSTNLDDLTANDFEELGKGVRVLPLLLKFHKNKGVYVRNKSKFCRTWKREKKRRSVGNCIVESWNEANGKILKVGGESHSFGVAKRSRKQASVCHKGGKLCDGVNTHYTKLNEKIEMALNAVRAKIVTQTAKNATFQCSDNQRHGARTLRDMEERKTELEIMFACAGRAVVQATKSNCIAAITSETANRQAYTPPALANCRKSVPGATYRYDFNSAEESLCWDAGTLKPQHAFTFDGEPKKVGVVRTVNISPAWYNDWAANASCTSSGSTLKTIPSKCSSKYKDLVDLDDDDKLCDDEVVVYADETCAINSGDIGSRKSEIVNTVSNIGSGPGVFHGRFESCYEKTVRPAQNSCSYVSSVPDSDGNCPVYTLTSGVRCTQRITRYEYCLTPPAGCDSSDCSTVQRCFPPESTWQEERRAIRACERLQEQESNQ